MCLNELMAGYYSRWAIEKFFLSGITVIVFADLFSPKSCGPPLKLSTDLKISLQWFQVFFKM